MKMPATPGRPPLTPAEIRALPERARVLIKWSGGNGPWLYELRRHVDSEGSVGKPPYTLNAWSIHENRPYGRPDEFNEVETVLPWNHEEVWGERMLHKVWLPDG